MSYSSFDIWRSLGGLAFFMLGMGFLEEGMKQLTGRRFKLFLRKYSSRKITAISSAALITGVLQSSSVVNLMILALTGTGVIAMKHALALMLGSNLGTTLSTWFVATAGFKLNLEVYTMPVIGVAGICLALFKKNTQRYHWSLFFMGIGFLFFGLDLLKTGIGSLVTNINLGALQDYPAIFYLLVGLVITALIQSSSATIAIALSALHVGAIDLYAATAISLGSEVGTTLKLLLASADSAVKKQVAAGNFTYNCLIALLMLAVLRPVNALITGSIGIHDPLIALSFFQTFTNLAGILLFFPFLNFFGSRLERLFTTGQNRLQYIDKVPVPDVELALPALQKEASAFIGAVIIFSKKIFEPENHLHLASEAIKRFAAMPKDSQYAYIKQWHGDIYSYSIQLQKASLSDEDAQLLNRLLAAVRNAMYAAKSMQDVFYDIDQLSNSGNEAKYGFYIKSKDKAMQLYSRLHPLLGGQEQLLFEEAVTLYKSVQDGYTHTVGEFYKAGNAGSLNEMEISTIINFNRELYTAFKSLILAMKDCLLSEKDAAYFDELPGFIH